MEWKNVKVPDGAKLFKVHNFTYMIKGVTWHFEIDEFADGSFIGHGEHSTDKNSLLESVNGKSVQECLDALVRKVKN